MPEHDMSRPRRYGRIKEAVKDGGVASRRKLYDIHSKYGGVLKKLDGITVVDFVRLDEIIAAAPDAKVKGSA
jgi:hypothetical protein